MKPHPILILKKVYGNKQIILMPLSSSLVAKYRRQLDETFVSFFQSLVAVLMAVSAASGCTSAPTLHPFLFPVCLLFFICTVVLVILNWLSKLQSICSQDIKLQHQYLIFTQKKLSQAADVH